MDIKDYLEDVNLPLKLAKKRPWKTILAYIFIGINWVLFSDKILGFFVKDQMLYMKIQSFKGIFYVIMTAIMLHFFIKLDYKKIIGLNKAISIKNQELVSFSEELIAMEDELNEKIKSLNTTMDNLSAQQVFSEVIFNSTNTSIMVTTLEGKIIKQNAHFSETFGYTSEEILGRHWIDEFVFEEVKDASKRFFKALKRNERISNYENKMKTKSGDVLDMIWNGAVVQEPLSKEWIIVFFGIDLTLEKKNEKIAYELAFTDRLTGFDNRAVFERKVSEHIYKQKPFTLYYLDIDNFRNINDIHGRKYGDLFLQEFSDRLKSHLQGCQLFRWCGDEFMILDHDVTQERLVGRKEEFSKIIQKMWCCDHIEYHPSASIGVVQYPNDGATIEDIFKNIDIALHHSKNCGKSYICQYEPSFQRGLERKLHIDNTIHKALKEEGFNLVFQPIYNMSLDVITGAEVLLRLDDRYEGINTGELIEVAESTGQILKIDQWVLKTAFEIIAGPLKDKNISISINLSAKTLSKVDSLDYLKMCLEMYSVNPEQIIFELTEHSLINDLESGLKLVSILKDLGFKVALDDFGTRYSSLNYLSHMPFDSLKIDKSYINNIVDVNNDRIIVEQIIKLTKRLGIKTVAEGIENQTQYEVLKSLDCDFGQGFHLSRPVSLEKLLGQLD